MHKPFIKKPILLSILAGLLIGFTAPENGITDLEKNHFKGSVKSVMETKYSLLNEGGSEKKDKITFRKFTLFDIYGNETESTLFKNGDKFLTSIYYFGFDGKKVEMNEYHPDSTLNVNVIYKYDDNGFRSEAIYNWAENRQIGEFTEKTDYYYEIIQNDIFTKVLYKNEYRGYCIEENYMKADGSLSFKFAAKYDFRGNKLESGYFHGNGRLSWMTKYRYDRYDNLIESRVFKSNRIAVVSVYDYKFDLHGNWVIRIEDRQVYVNILTEGLDRENALTERIIEYY